MCYYHVHVSVLHKGHDFLKISTFCHEDEAKQTKRKQITDRITDIHVKVTERRAKREINKQRTAVDEQW